LLLSWRRVIPPIERPAPKSFSAESIAHGEALAAAGHCASCHTRPGGQSYADGYGVNTPFEVIHGANITPDPKTGVGTWPLEAFLRAMREGVARDGSHPFPAFPYNAFTELTDDDLKALHAYLMTRLPASATVPSNTVPFPLSVRALRHPPLVVEGVEHEVALFHRLTTYPACVEPGIRGLPGHLGQNEMYQQSLELVRSVTTGPARRALERFDKQIGTGHASADVQEIVRAASIGRVEHLFLLENGAVPGAVDGGADLLETAAVQTLRHGGDVQTLLETSMPSGGPICAIFRYASEGS